MGNRIINIGSGSSNSPFKTAFNSNGFRNARWADLDDSLFGEIGGSAVDFSTNNSVDGSEGYGALANWSHAHGFNLKVTGQFSSARGNVVDISGEYSQGNGATVNISGNYSTGYGSDVTITGSYSLASGTSLLSNSDYNLTFGTGLENGYYATLLLGVNSSTVRNNVFSGGNIFTNWRVSTGNESIFKDNVYTTIASGFGNVIGNDGGSVSANAEWLNASAIVGVDITVPAGMGSLYAGVGLTGSSPRTAVFGAANIDLTQTPSTNNTGVGDSYNPRLIVGTGSWNYDSNAGTRANGFVVMSDGVVSAPSLTIAKINTPTVPTGASANFADRILITKEYADANYSGGGGGLTTFQQFYNTDAVRIDSTDTFSFIDFDIERNGAGIKFGANNNYIFPTDFIDKGFGKVLWDINDLAPKYHVEGSDGIDTGRFFLEHKYFGAGSLVATEIGYSFSSFGGAFDDSNYSKIIINNALNNHPDNNYTGTPYSANMGFQVGSTQGIVIGDPFDISSDTTNTSFMYFSLSAGITIKQRGQTGLAKAVPVSFTDGVTTVDAASDGTVDLSSLSLGGAPPAIPTLQQVVDAGGAALSTDNFSGAIFDLQDAGFGEILFRVASNDLTGASATGSETYMNEEFAGIANFFNGYAASVDAGWDGSASSAAMRVTNLTTGGATGLVNDQQISDSFSFKLTVPRPLLSNNVEVFIPYLINGEVASPGGEITIKQEFIAGTRFTDLAVDGAVTGTYNLNLDSYVKFNLNMISDTTFAFTGIPSGDNVKVVEVILSGDFVPTWFDGIQFDPDSNTYDGTKYNRLTLTFESDFIRGFLKNLEDV